MKKITQIYYEAKDGKLFHSQTECEQHEKYVDWQLNIPKVVDDIYHVVVNYLHSEIVNKFPFHEKKIDDIKHWVKLERIGTISENKLEFRIRLSFSFSTYAKIGSSLLLILSNIDFNDTRGSYLTYEFWDYQEKSTNKNSIFFYIGSNYEKTLEVINNTIDGMGGFAFPLTIANISR
jgi:hypothetical protein